MDFEELFIGVVLFSLVVSVFSISYVTTASQYHLGASSFSAPYNRLQNVTDDVMGTKEQVFGSVNGSQGGSSQDDSLTTLVRRVWTALTSIPAIFVHVEGLLYEVLDLFKVSPVVGSAIVVMAVAVVVFTIIRGVIGIIKR